MDLEGVDFRAESRAFVSVKRSRSTRAAYAGALRLLEEWLARNALALGDITPRRAADFLHDLEAQGWRDSNGVDHRTTASTTRAIVTACSSFFSHLERRFAGIRNPFHGLSTVRAAPAQTEAIPAP